MEEFIYEAFTIEEGIEMAEKELNISAEDFDYEIIDKKGIIRKKYTIRVVPHETSVNDGLVSVKDGKFKVIDSKENGKSAKIYMCDKVNLYIDDKKVEDFCNITENNVVNYDIINQEAKREINIVTSDDDMKVFATIKYIPKRTYKICDSEDTNELHLEVKVVSEQYPPKYTETEVKEMLAERGIVQGTNSKNIVGLCRNGSEEEVLIAEGKEAIPTVQDSIEMLYIEKNRKTVSEDEKIDFRNLNSIATVSSGEVIARLVKGGEGKPGLNIYGKVIKVEPYKELSVVAGDGCTTDGINVVAAIEGKPEFKKNIFTINKIYEVKSDIDMSTGNLSFTGDIHIGANVNQGMTIKAGKSITIDGTVEGSHVISNDETIIKGSVIGSTIEAGGRDLLIQQQIEWLNNLKSSLAQLTGTVMEIKEHNLLGKDRTDGEIIKVLIENKFKNITGNALHIINLFSKSDEDGQKLSALVRKMLIGLGPTTIKHFSELDKIVSLADEMVKSIEESSNKPSDVIINYCQDSTINASGDIYINGKGQYISHLTSTGSIIFTQNSSVCRGGYLKAEKEIRCKTIGSTGGVKTHASVVSREGHIYADIAYHNTVVRVGEREIIIDEPSKNVHVYMNELGDIIIDKFRL